MNERPAVNRLREAMRNADYSELEGIAVELGQEAVAQALTDGQQPLAKALEHRPDMKVSVDEERQRLLDAALADAIETVARQRMRLGRRVCSRPDATVTRQIYEALRSMASADGGSDNDPSFQ